MSENAKHTFYFLTKGTQRPLKTPTWRLEAAVLTNANDLAKKTNMKEKQNRYEACVRSVPI